MPIKLSYEDMMDDRKLTDVYNSEVVGKDTLDERSAENSA